MFVIQKKRLYIILLSLLVGIVVFEAKLEGNQNQQLIATVSLPVNSKVIVLDARSWIPR